jgi:hypothetical protein
MATLKFRENGNKIFFGGCPKRKHCELYEPQNVTCKYGPPEYCGKYRLTVEQEKEKSPQIIKV